jgi:peptidoglycan/xylan/chitin deacetylase (PgdA/CDA1 family)
VNVAVTFDNLGEATDLERGLWPEDEPVGRHFSVTRALPRLLGALGELGLRATFFVEGVNAELHPATLEELAAAGHEVALHGYRHRNQMRLPPRALADDLRRGVHAIGEATGRVPALYRPPYGIFTPAGLALARRAGWLPLLWSRWGRDWRADTTPDEIARRATRDLHPGDVILVNDGLYAAGR